MMTEREESERTLQAPVHARIVFYTVDCARRRVTRSANSPGLLGLPASGAADDWQAVVLAEDLPQYLAALDALTPEAPAFETEYRIHHPVTRQPVWVLDRGEGEFNGAGTLARLSGAVIDISTRISAERELRKRSEAAAAHLAAIVQSSEDAIISKSLLGVVTSWNVGAERLFGYRAEEMVGWSITRILPSEQEHEETTILGTIRKGESIAPYESLRRHKSGRIIHVSISVSPIRDERGVVIGASTIARDVTERRRNIETLRQNEARLRMALRGARAGAWDYDLQRREMHWSHEMFALYGRDPAAGPPEREALVRQIVPAHRKRARMEFARAMLQGGSFTLEFPIIRPDGSEIWTALSGDVIKDARGRPVSARGIDQDITERKTWEKRQAALLRELSHRVKNTLAVIQSVARQTLRSSGNPKAFVDAFEGRIRSLAVSHTLLTEINWSGARLDSVIRGQIANAIGDAAYRRVNLRGPEVTLNAEMATQLGLVFHELATNAIRHGALSNAVGQVDIVWTATRRRLRLLWRERGGPGLEGTPEHIGFGTLLILSSALKVQRSFTRRGLTCKMQFAL